MNPSFLNFKNYINMLLRRRNIGNINYKKITSNFYGYPMLPLANKQNKKSSIRRVQSVL